MPNFFRKFCSDKATHVIIPLPLDPRHANQSPAHRIVSLVTPALWPSHLNIPYRAVRDSLAAPSESFRDVDNYKYLDIVIISNIMYKFLFNSRVPIPSSLLLPFLLSNQFCTILTPQPYHLPLFISSHQRQSNFLQTSQELLTSL